MGIDYKNGAINDTWESVQQRVRSYALDRNLMVSPGSNGICQSGADRLRLYKDTALVPVAEFWPYFKRNGENPTPKEVKTEYVEDPSIKDLLSELEVTSV